MTYETTTLISIESHGEPLPPLPPALVPSVERTVRTEVLEKNQRLHFTLLSRGVGGRVAPQYSCGSCDKAYRVDQHELI